MKPSSFIYIIFNMIVIAAGFLSGEQRFFIFALIIWTNLVYYAVKDLNNRSALLAFLIGFFIFLMGRQLLERSGIHSVELKFSNELNIHAERLLFISLLSFSIGYFFFKKVKFVFGDAPRKINDAQPVASIRVISKYAFLLTYPFCMLNILDVARYVLSHGYLAYYTSYSYSMPYVVRKLADITKIAFWIYMATMPKKKECKSLLTLYGIYLVSTLFTGKRYPFVSGLLVLFVYATFRNHETENRKEEQWYDKRMLLVLLVLSPFLIGSLSIFNDLRFGRGITQTSILDAMTSFIYQQGGSINFIKRAELYKNRLPEDKIYIISNTVRILQQNAIGRALGVTTYGGNTVSNALYGNSIAHTLSYIVLGKAYLAGNGLGCCYIAESYHDFGDIGVILVNFFYGYIFSRWFNFSNMKIWGTAISFIILDDLILAPRGNTDGFMGTMLDITTWGTFLLVFIIAYGLQKRHRTNR